MSWLGKNGRGIPSHLHLLLVDSKPRMDEYSPEANTQISSHSVFIELAVKRWEWYGVVATVWGTGRLVSYALLHCMGIHWYIVPCYRMKEGNVPASLVSLLSPNVPCQWFGPELPLLNLVMFQFSLLIVHFTKFSMKMIESDHWQFKNSH